MPWTLLTDTFSRYIVHGRAESHGRSSQTDLELNFLLVNANLQPRAWVCFAVMEVTSKLAADAFQHDEVNVELHEEEIDLGIQASELRPERMTWSVSCVRFKMDSWCIQERTKEDPSSCVTVTSSQVDFSINPLLDFATSNRSFTRMSTSLPLQIPNEIALDPTAPPVDDLASALKDVSLTHSPTHPPTASSSVKPVPETGATEQVVTPWDVQGQVSADGQQLAINYDKLIDQFGTRRIDASLLERFEKLTGHKPHPLLRRGTFFSHRCVHQHQDWIIYSFKLQGTRQDFRSLRSKQTFLSVHRPGSE